MSYRPLQYVKATQTYGRFKAAGDATYVFISDIDNNVLQL